VMVVANEISPERKNRLAKRGINYREIPEEVIQNLRPPDPIRASQPSVGAPTHVALGAPSPLPEWFRTHLSQFNATVRERVRAGPAK